MSHSNHCLSRPPRRPAGRWASRLLIFPVLAALAILGLAAPAARAATRTVTSRNDTGAGSLRAVVAASAAGDTITFSVTGTITLTSGQITLAQPVTLQGPGAGSLAIDGSKSSRIFEVSAASGTVTLSGLTLQNAYVDNDTGAGLMNDGRGTALVLTGCTVANCVNDSGGIGGGLFSNGGTMTLTNCVFTNNHANSGGGVQADGTSGRATVTNCVFTGNSAGDGSGGGYYNIRGQSTLTNCVFTGNTADFYGGGFFSNTATSTLIHCSFTGNTAPRYGGALGYFNSPTTLTDDIFYGDSASSNPEIWLYSGAAATVTYCDVQGGLAGKGNFSADPAFVSGTAPYDLRVRPGSPVVAAGVTVPGVTRDITGAIRPDPPTVGAYEGVPAVTQTRIALAGGSSASIPVGGSASFTVTVANASSPGGPNGTIQLRLNGSPVGSPVALANGSATLTYAFTQAGTYAVSAAYTPDADNFLASVSSSLTETVVGTPTANAQNVAVAFNTAKAVTLTGSDPDSPPRALTYAVTSGPTHGTLSGLNASTGTGTYTPTAGYHGTDSFTFTVNNGVSTSSPATVSLTVMAGTPAANSQSVSVAFNTAQAITLTGSDPDSPPLPLTYAVAVGPTHGTLSGFSAATGAVTYTPTAGYTGPDSFTFRVNNGTNTSSAATVSLTVTAGTPTASGQSVSVAFNTAKAVTLTGSDPDSPPLALTYAVTTSPTHGTLTGTAPNLTYTPTSGYHGADSFQFTVSNGSSTSTAATVTLTVAAGVPTANPQSVSTSQGNTVGITLTGSDPDVPALQLTYSVASGPAHGTLTGTAPNLTYTPAAGYFGSDSFTFTVTNGVNTSTAATVSLTVIQAAASDVTAQVTASRGGFRYVRATGHYLQPVTLANTGTTLADPVSLVLDGLTGATLVGASGTTSAAAPAGSPYVTLPAGGLAAGASVTVTLEFTAQPTGYAVRVLAGPGAR